MIINNIINVYIIRLQSLILENNLYDDVIRFTEQRD